MPKVDFMKRGILVILETDLMVNQSQDSILFPTKLSAGRFPGQKLNIAKGQQQVILKTDLLVNQT